MNIKFQIYSLRESLYSTSNSYDIREKRRINEIFQRKLPKLKLDENLELRKTYTVFAFFYRYK